MGFTTYFVNKLIDHASGKAAYPMPDQWLGFFTGLPTDAGGGTEVSNSGTAYARVQIPASSLSAAAARANTNTAAILFAKATANWGTLLGWGIWDDPVAGNLLDWDDFTPPGIIVLTDDTIQIDIGDFDRVAPPSS